MSHSHNVGGHRVDFTAILVSHDVSTGAPRIRSQDDTVLEHDPANGGAGLGRLWGIEAFLKQELVPLAVLEGESRWRGAVQTHRCHDGL